MILYGGSKPYPVSATPTAFASQIGQFPPYDKSQSPLNSQNKTSDDLFRQRTHLIHARHTYICGRADNACTNLLGFLVRYVRTRGLAETVESG